MSEIQQFDYSVNLLQSLLWQYNEAGRLQKLLELKQDWYNTNQTEFWQNWERDVFNLATANDFGLTVWSIILGRILNVTTAAQNPDLPTWGFADTHKNFNNGNFRRSTAGSISLTIDQKRIVLQLRYFQLVTRGAIPEINRFLKRVFADLGQVYVLDGLDMTMTYVFTFVPSSGLQFVLEQYDVLPRPAGVKLKILVLTEPAFGFDEFHENFDNGNFIS